MLFFLDPAGAAPTTVAFAVVSQWFDKREGLATGCVALGAPVGGIFFSLVLQLLFDKLPWTTAILTLSAILFSFMLVGNVLVKTSPTQQAAAVEWDFAVVRDMLRSPKFYLVAYAIFGEFLHCLALLALFLFFLSFLVRNLVF